MDASVEQLKRRRREGGFTETEGAIGRAWSECVHRKDREEEEGEVGERERERVYACVCVSECVEKGSGACKR